MRTLLTALFAAALVLTPALAAEAPTCEYCGEAWDTDTRVQAVMRVNGLAETMYFDSAWHALAYKWSQQKGGNSVAVLMMAVQDYAAATRNESLWILEDDANRIFAVLTPAQFPGARKEPFTAFFAAEEDAKAFAAKHDGEVLTDVELEKRLYARWQEESK